MSILAMPPSETRPALAAAVRELVRHDGDAPDRATLEAWGRAALARCHLPETHLGYAMVLASNAWWEPAFAAVPQRRRVLLLPHCLRPAQGCAAPVDAQGLHCLGCGGCDIGPLRAEAEALGWRVMVAEGTGALADEMLTHERDAVLGVACLDSLERSFARVRELGIPHLAVPLDRDGCSGTDVDGTALRALMRAEAAAPPTQRTWLPLLREAGRLCGPESLTRLLGDLADGGRDVLDAQALDWLAGGGKRLRAFVALAAYAVGRHGAAALRPDADLAALLPDDARRVALAIEAMHKASLLHDDIADDEAERYGRPALHRAHGVATALNLGDHLIGLGYRLIAQAGAGAVGAPAALAIATRLSDAHLALCRGQGDELRRRAGGGLVTPLQALDIAAGKTAPAFAAALAAGLLAAGGPCDNAAITRFARCLGEAFQVLDDLDDWRGDGAAAGEDVRLGQPTILRAFALERVARTDLAPRPDEKRAALVARVRGLYAGCGAFTRAGRLAERLRQRALDEAATLRPEPVAALGLFLARAILAPRGT